MVAVLGTMFIGKYANDMREELNRLRPYYYKASERNRLVWNAAKTNEYGITRSELEGIWEKTKTPEKEKVTP